MIPAKFQSNYRTFEASARPLLDHLMQKIEADLSVAVNLVEVNGRVKGVDSCFQKLQKGSIASLEDITDKIGIAVVVRRRSDTRRAIDALHKSGGYQIRDQDPEPRNPADFSYREPKVFISPLPHILDSHEQWRGLEVEVQFTTELQHAVDYATHDYDYKGADYEWTKFRMVARLRAMLELVDAMIDDIDSVVIDERETVMEPASFAAGKSILKAIDENFDEESISPDRKRLADTVNSWLQLLGIEPSALGNLLQADPRCGVATSVDTGSHILGVLVEESKVAIDIINASSLYFVVSEEAVTFYPKLDKILPERRVGL